MKKILKPIFELITGEFVLFGNVIYNYIAMGIVGVIAFVVAFTIVGKLYDEDMISGSCIGSLVHWIVRTLVFLVVFYILSVVIWLIKFIMTIPWWGWVTVIGIIVFIGITSVIIKRRNGGI